jgi:hypothetical protein
MRFRACQRLSIWRDELMSQPAQSLSRPWKLVAYASASTGSQLWSSASVVQRSRQRDWKLATDCVQHHQIMAAK